MLFPNLKKLFNSVNDVPSPQFAIYSSSLSAFSKDSKTLDAVVRNLEIIGETAKRIPDEIKQRYKDIPWKRVAGMRNKLIHEYFGVDTEILLVVIKEELPPLKPLVKKILDKMEEKYKNQVAF